ncbi:hypothetical protein GC093_14600 [Paenibacillus sp. LMG 31456]|uniref:Uncharacterized protein n=1 Tax=Paenibacillus foliorum TaxID=2654974 RepID=A0A972GPH8_9BACL|nr:hypothetical protein [Paenibacillus foliorum]NOU94437.1 hypothetical protein [Paenibacillus foliorum]
MEESDLSIKEGSTYVNASFIREHVDASLLVRVQYYFAVQLKVWELRLNFCLQLEIRVVLYLSTPSKNTTRTAKEPPDWQFCWFMEGRCRLIC